MSILPSREQRKVRSLFISDVHLGCRHSQAGQLLRFLKQYHPEYLYVVGDFIDGWKLKRRWRWQPEYDAILKHLLILRESGTKLFYAPGNHDDFLRPFLEHLGVLRLVHVQDHFVHVTADRRRFLVTHGDQFDDIERNAPWLSLVSSIAYDGLLTANRLWNRLRRHSGDPYAFSNAIKRRVKRLVQHVSEFEGRWVTSAREHQCHGIICGHIHAPRIAHIENLAYCNTGDWVENCSALVEYVNGDFELIRHDGTVIGRLPTPRVPARGVAAAETAPVPQPGQLEPGFLIA
jgi:UDP-2,3-diacylglucosamine pyrophosphatase LpxH